MPYRLVYQDHPAGASRPHINEIFATSQLALRALIDLAAIHKRDVEVVYYDNEMAKYDVRAALEDARGPLQGTASIREVYPNMEAESKVRLIHQLAASIRRIDGAHTMGAGELAEKLVEEGWNV